MRSMSYGGIRTLPMVTPLVTGTRSIWKRLHKGAAFSFQWQHSKVTEGASKTWDPHKPWLFSYWLYTLLSFCSSSWDTNLAILEFISSHHSEGSLQSPAATQSRAQNWILSLYPHESQLFPANWYQSGQEVSLSLQSIVYRKIRASGCMRGWSQLGKWRYKLASWAWPQSSWWLS
jgi:hypothetical protein